MVDFWNYFRKDLDDFLLGYSFLFYEEDGVVSSDSSKDLGNIAVVYVVSDAASVSRSRLDNYHISGESDRLKARAQCHLADG